MGDFWPDLTKYKEKLKAKLPDFKPGSEKKLQDILADISDKMTWKRWCILAFTMLILILGGSMLVFGTGGSRRELATDQVVYVEIKSGMSATIVKPIDVNTNQLVNTILSNIQLAKFNR